MTNITIVEDSDDEFKPNLSDSGPVLGQWYWYKGDADEMHYHEKDGRSLFGLHGRRGKDRLMCAMKIGSNYVDLQSPNGLDNSGCYTGRVHFKDFWTTLQHEPDADRIILQWARDQQYETKRLLGEIQLLTQRLGMAPRKSIEHSPGASAGGALMVMNEAPDLEGYKVALTSAKEKLLPELYDHVKASNGNLAALLNSQTLPTIAQVGDMKETIKDINGRIFSISLYAGLAEDTTQVQDGEPAAIDEKLHVMQSRLYMDEECLANYRHGGMEFGSIGEFDAWLCEPENLNRILPFPRTLVAMRVRRNLKDRDWSGGLRDALINFRLEQADKITFLYIRNGQQVWCIQSELEFDEFIFPDRSAFDPNEPKMAHVDHRTVKYFVSRSNWEDMCVRYDKEKADSEQWDKDHPNARKEHLSNPFHMYGSDDPRSKYHPVDSSSVYFDDAMAMIEDEIEKYNRIAVIIQGLFDRSMVLHPHHPVQSWTSDGFDKAITLVYDGHGTLHSGEAPDFEAYRAQCNKTMKAGSLVIGQEEQWQLKEGEKESERRRGDYRLTENERWREIKKYKPRGNPGPGYIAAATTVTRTGKVTFNWERKRLTDASFSWEHKSETIPASTTVQIEHLFNVDAYQLGDFKKFYADRRTRAEYLQWAPMLIAAEEHHFNLQSKDGQ